MKTLQYFLRILDHTSAGGLTEVSVAPGTYQARVGYFHNIREAADAIATYDGKQNVFASLNPVRRDLLARANNRLIPCKNRFTDNDALCDSWFLVDIDPKRPKGISSTQEELHAALKVGEAITTFLINAGVKSQSIVTAMSGNGAYVLIRLPDYPIAKELIDRKKAWLNFIADLFSNDMVEIDRKVYNPSRLVGVVGTIKCKGDPIAERPHRRSEILTIGGIAFDASANHHVEQFDLYGMAERLLSKQYKIQPENKELRSRSNNGHFDIRNHIDLLEGYHETARGWAYARCPAHKGDGNTSLFINIDNGAYGCFGDCTTKQIREEMGISKPMGEFKQELNHKGSRSVTVSCPVQEQEKQNTALQCLADVNPEQVTWLWYPRIPKGKLTLIEGDPGVGKSWVACGLAAAISAGHGLPDTKQIEAGNTLILSAEDGLGDTIRPRLDSLNADTSRIFAIDGALVLNDSGLLELEAHIIECKPVLVIIDPLVAYLGASVDLHRANETRVVMSALARLAERYGCAIVGVRHLTKGGKDRAIYRGIGSIDLTAACRSVLLVGSDPDDQSRSAIVQIKNNLAELGGAVGYEIRGGRFSWTGASNLTAGRILASIDEEERVSRHDAEQFLREVLAEGAKPAKEILREAQEAGISEMTLRRAKGSIGVKTRKEGQPGTKKQRWVWELLEALEHAPRERG